MPRSVASAEKRKKISRKADFAFGTLAGVISYVAAILTNFVEVHGFWRPLWLAICIASFICAAGLIAEGARNFGKRA
jgi:hypothetical protein